LRITRVLREDKTAEVELEIINCSIAHVTISGDFFVYPEETIDFLEVLLKGCNNFECILDAFNKVRSAIIIGISWEALEKAVTESFRELCRNSS